MKTTPPRTILTLTALCASATLLFTGCSSTSTGVKQAESATTGITKTREQINEAKKLLDETVTALDSLVNTPQPDLRPQFKSYTSAVDALTKRAEKARDRATEMKAKRESFFKNWEAELAAIQNPSIRKRSAEQMEKSKVSFGKIETELSKARDNFTGFLSDLQDIQRYLSNNLNPGGVASIKDLAAGAKKTLVECQGHIGAALVELDAVAAEVSPVQAAPK